MSRCFGSPRIFLVNNGFPKRYMSDDVKRNLSSLFGHSILSTGRKMNVLIITSECLKSQWLISIFLSVEVVHKFHSWKFLALLVG